MKYQNTKTGAVIEVDSEISGGNWQAVTPADKPAKKSQTGKKKGEPKDE